VLSFPEEEGRKGDPVAGDIAISLDALRRNAVQFDVPQNEEMKRLLVHGLLHLAGMNHGEGRGGKMLVLQEKLLGMLQSERIYGGTRT
jgi:probable rRNA maturation factor